jgi:hypothetical protein
MVVPSLAAGWATAGLLWLRLHRPHECAHELSVYLRRNRIHIDVLTGKELTSVLYAVNSGWLNLNFLEASGRELAAIFVFFEGTRNAANPQKHTLANLRRHLATGHNVGYSQASARFQDAKGFPQDLIFVR